MRWTRLLSVCAVFSAVGFLPFLGGCGSGGLDAARQSRENLQHIGLTLHNYHDVAKGFPAAYGVDLSGKPMLSWRVHILPFLGEKEAELFEKFHLDEPWDSPHNKALIKQMPDYYRSPFSNAEPGMTVYLGNAAKGGVFIPPKVSPRTLEQLKQSGKKDLRGAPNLSTGTRVRDIRDGTANTIAVVEVDDSLAVPWTKPVDFVPAADDPAKGLRLIGDSGDSHLVLFTDGGVRVISNKNSKETVRGLMTTSRGEAFNLK